MAAGVIKPARLTTGAVYRGEGFEAFANCRLSVKNCAFPKFRIHIRVEFQA
jgi:hypothetical protein